MIDLDLVECAGLAHDIGHPPFGHVGERALHDRMRHDGGFEGNAQTLRLLACLEKKISEGHDLGLNLTYQTLASILKKCEEIPTLEVGAKKKGYYASEAGLVKQIRTTVLGEEVENSALFQGENFSKLRTQECAIMDIADDIAYATYDLEDSFKGGFLNAMDMLACSDELAQEIASKISSDHETPSEYKHPSLKQVKDKLRDLASIGLNGILKELRPKTGSYASYFPV